jgi:hypothetical protein
LSGLVNRGIEREVGIIPSLPPNPGPSPRLWNDVSELNSHSLKNTLKGRLAAGSSADYSYLCRRSVSPSEVTHR